MIWVHNDDRFHLVHGNTTIPTGDVSVLAVQTILKQNRSGLQKENHDHSVSILMAVAHLSVLRYRPKNKMQSLVPVSLQ